MSNKIREQLKEVKEKYNSFLEECKSLDKLAENESLNLTFAIRKLVIGSMTDTRELIIEVDSQLEFSEIKTQDKLIR